MSSFIPRNAAALLLALTLALSSCAPADGTGGEDAAGGPFDVAPATVVPDLRIGAVDDTAYAFGFVGGMAVHSDGTMYTAHPRSTEIRRWSRDGEPEGRVGRRGEGPGEFESVTRIGLLGDTLWVFDNRQYRVSWFGPDGAFVRSVSPRFELGRIEEGSSKSHPRPDVPLPDGTFYGNEPTWSHAVVLGDLTETAHVHMDADGRILDTLWVQPVGTADVLGLMNPDGPGGTFGSQPFGDADMASFDPTREALYVLERRVREGEDPAAFHVMKLSMTGDTLFRRSVEYEPRPLTAGEVDSVVAVRAESMHDFMSRSQPGLTVAALEERIREALYVPAHHPPVDAFVVGRDGRIWIRRPEPVGDAGDRREWWVLDAEGRPEMPVTTPAGLTLREADADHVWGVERDDLDVNYVVRYRIAGGDEEGSGPP